MAYVEKCDMVWGSDGRAVLIRGDFERRLEEDGRMSKRASTLTTPSRRASSLQWRRKSQRSSPSQSLDSLDSIGESSDVSDVREVVQMKDVDERRRKIMNRPGERIRRIARNTGEIGLKIVALPTFVLLDIVS